MSQFPPPDPNSPDPNSADQADQETVRAILRAAPTLVVPRNFTLDPAIYGRSRLRSERVIGFPGVWRGLAAVAAILVVVLAVSFANQKNQANPNLSVNNAVALNPTNQPATLTLNAALRSTVAPSITIIAPGNSAIANTAQNQNQDSITGQSTQINVPIPKTATGQIGEANGNTPQLQSAPQNAAASGAIAPQAQLGQAPTSLPINPTATQIAGIPQNKIFATPDLPTQFAAILRALLYWLRLIPAP